MSDNTPTDPAATNPGGAGGLEARAKAIAQRRAAQRAARSAEQPPEPPAAAGRGGKRRADVPDPSTPVAPSPVNPFLPNAPAPTQPGLVEAIDPATGAADKRSEERGGGGGGLAELGFGHTSGPVDPPLATAPLNPAVVVPAALPETPAPGPQGAVVQLVGLHGGAGVRTLSALIGPQALDCGTGLDSIRSVDVPVLFVTRSHAYGLDLALRLGQQYAARSLEPLMVLGVVVVYDAPTLSKGLARTLKSVEKALPNCWIVPWSEDLRHAVTPPDAASRGRLGRSVRSVLKKAGELRESREPPHERRRTSHL